MDRADSIDELIYKEDKKGYRAELLDIYPEACVFIRKLTVCGRCAGILNKPCLMKCLPQMIVCTNCLREHEKETSLTIVEEAILGLGARCPLLDRECKWHGNLGDLVEHMGNCEELVVTCPQKCNSVVERKYVKRHVENECEMKMTSCKHCRVQHYIKDTQSHSDKCQYLPIECSCGEHVRRKDYQLHKQDICKDTLVECSFRIYGCKETFKREFKLIHEREYLIWHLNLEMNSLVWEIIEGLEDRNGTLMREIELFEELTTYSLVLDWKLDIKGLMDSALTDGPTFTVPSCSIEFYTKCSLNVDALTLLVSVWPINTREAFSYDFWTIFVDQDEGKLCMTRDGHYRCFDNKEIQTNTPMENSMVIARIPTVNLNKASFNKNGIVNIKLFTRKHA